MSMSSMFSSGLGSGLLTMTVSDAKVSGDSAGGCVGGIPTVISTIGAGCCCSSESCRFPFTTVETPLAKIE